MCEGEPFAGAPIAFNQGSGCKIRKKFALPRVRQIKKRPKASFLFGGGEESRTPVRKPVRTAFYECSCSFNIPSVCRRTAGCRLQ